MSEDQPVEGTGEGQSTDDSGVRNTADPPTSESSGTPEPPANRLLRPTALGNGWDYTAGSMPNITDNGTIWGVYRTSQEYPRTIRTRLWPCEGATLEALGGTCSLGDLPDRYRQMEDVETATFSIGGTAFGWWSGPPTDIEVVAHQHVFRMTHTPLPGQTATTSSTLPSRDARLSELRQTARQQVDKLARFE